MNFGTLELESNGMLYVWLNVGYTSRNMEDVVTEGDLNCADLAQEVSEEKNFSL